MDASLDMGELRGFAGELARLGATIAGRWLGHVTASRKADQSPVTEADHAVQAEIVRRITERHPDHAIIAEEFLAHDPARPALENARYCWVIDPIDGTLNFARGVPIYATTVALMLDGIPIVGAIFDALHQQLYTAAASAGAACEGAALTIRDPDPADDRTLLMSSLRGAQPPPAMPRWLTTYHFRNFGSLALHLAWVGAGRAHAACAIKAHLWDIAAGSLIITEAGGIVTDVRGANRWPVHLATQGRDAMPVLCGTPAMHAELLTPSA